MCMATWLRKLLPALLCVVLAIIWKRTMVVIEAYTHLGESTCTLRVLVENKGTDYLVLSME